MLQGAVGGFLSGIVTCLFISIGTMIYPKPKGIQLPVSVDGCSKEIMMEVTSDIWNSAINKNYTLDYRPE